MPEAFAKAILRSAAQAELLDSIGQNLPQLRKRKRLREVIEYAQPEGGSHAFKRGKSGDDDDAQLRPARQQLFDYFFSAGGAHLHIEQKDVRNARFRGGHQFRRLGKGPHVVVALVAQEIFDVVAEVEIVVKNGDVHTSGGCEGYLFAHAAMFIPTQRSGSGRKNYLQGCSTFGTIRGGNGSSVLGNDSFGNSKTKAGTASVEASTDERLKQI